MRITQSLYGEHGAMEEARRHFAKEETKIFPIAERNLSTETQCALARDWAARRAVAPAGENADHGEAAS